MRSPKGSILSQYIVIIAHLFALSCTGSNPSRQETIPIDSGGLLSGGEEPEGGESVATARDADLIDSQREDAFIRPDLGPVTDEDDDGTPLGEDCDDTNADVAPNAFELCDGLDNDCDEAIDEIHQSLGEPCQVGVGACRVIGALVCARTRLGTTCDVTEPLPSSPERCGDEIDNNCDGDVDEASCIEDCVPAEEECNEVDDDCDGQVDEEEVCSPICQPRDERCNQRDDDCDGRIDEERVCEEPCTPQLERCNTEDDDCDGVIDEGVQRACGGCGLSSPEICNDLDDDCDGWIDEGMRTQDEGADGCEGCTPELCNGADDDCDGQVDESLEVFCLFEIAQSDLGGVIGAQLGAQVLSAREDLNSDGVIDVFVAAPYVDIAESEQSLVLTQSNEVGGVWAVDGQTGDRLWRVRGPGAFGSTLAHADLSGDGVSELIVGTPRARRSGVLGGIVIYERGGRTLHTITPSEESGLGERLAVVRREAVWLLLIGESRYRLNESAPLGQIRALSFEAGWLNPQVRFQAQGTSAGERLGERIYVIPDQTQDEADDLWVTSRPFDGSDRRLLLLDGLSGARGDVRAPSFQSTDSFGSSIAFGGLSTEGVIEYAIGASRADASVLDEVEVGVGMVSLLDTNRNLYGHISPPSTSMTSATRDGFGASMAWLPSSGSGVLIIGSERGDRVWVYRPDAQSLTEFIQGTEGIGRSLSSSSTPNHDGTYRVFIGEPNAEGGRGRVRIFSAR